MDLGLEKYQAQLDKLSKLPRGVRAGVAPALCALVLGAYGYLFFMPARAERAAAREQQLQLQRRLAEVRAVAGNEAQVKEEIAALDRRLKEALRQLPNDKELPGLLTDVSSLGKNAGLEFKSFKPQQRGAQGVLRRGADRGRVHAAGTTTSRASSTTSRGCRAS